MATAQKPIPKSAQLIEVAQFGKYQPIGVTVTASKRIFVTFPRHQPYQYGVAEIVNGERKPYPDAAWNEFDSLHPQNHFMNAQAVVTDDANNIWILDPSNPSEKGTIAEGVKLLKVSLQTNKVEQVYRFEDLPKEKIAINDVRIDTKRNLAYFSEPKLSAIIVLNLVTRKSRLVLKNHPVTKADPNFKLYLDGKDVVDQKGKPFSSNVNGIALTKDGKYFYFRAINQTKLYRIGTEYLANETLSDSELAKHVEMVGETGVSHGMIADEKGDIFLSDSPEKAIRYITPSGELKTLVKDDRLVWPDTFAIGPDGFLYLTCSQMNRLPKYNDGEDKVDYPFRLYKIKLP